MNDTRYGHSSTSGGNQDQGERKDEGWDSRQGGRQSREPGRGDSDAGARSGSGAPGGSGAGERPIPTGTNTQGELAGIGEAARRSEERLDRQHRDADRAAVESGAGETGAASNDAAGTDQPPRMGGPLGPDPQHPHLPEGIQDTSTRGTGAGGFDQGVNAKVIGAVHQGAREEDPDAAS